MASLDALIVNDGSREAEALRCAGKAALADALRDARARSLALFAAYESALGPDMRVPHSRELNLPLWELGHIGWFSDWWIARNPELANGAAAHPDVPRLPPRRPGADDLYNSSAVAHATRWALDLPDAHAVRAELKANLNDTLARLSLAQENDEGLYFFRLALFHEDMHTEAATYMAQTLGLDPFGQGAQPHPAPQASTTAEALRMPATDWPLGRNGPGFDFDNERGLYRQAITPFEIDSQPVTWARYLPFVESGAANAREHWSASGWAWRQAQPSSTPRYLRHTATGWQCLRFGAWQTLDLSESARHLTAHEAQAWCHWAQRRLPTEGEWEAAALTLPAFQWGSVWEWTASAFKAWPGFEPHPYRDYSAPWFDGRPVLRGASPATAPRMRHARYRNFFPADRNDIVAGFRSMVDRAAD
jgi:iron(II)-dependent oxidoreductase